MGEEGEAMKRAAVAWRSKLIPNKLANVWSTFDHSRTCTYVAGILSSRIKSAGNPATRRFRPRRPTRRIRDVTKIMTDILTAVLSYIISGTSGMAMMLLITQKKCCQLGQLGPHLRPPACVLPPVAAGIVFKVDVEKASRSDHQ